MTDMVNQNEPSELNAGVLLRTPISGKGGKAKKSSRSVKYNKIGTQASAGFNAGEFWPEMVLCMFFLSPRRRLLVGALINILLYVL